MTDCSEMTMADLIRERHRLLEEERKIRKWWLDILDDALAPNRKESEAIRVQMTMLNMVARDLPAERE